MTTRLRPPIFLAAPALALALLAAAAVGPAACASSGPAVAVPTGPIELDGTRWKLLSLRGKIDGRVIKFTKRGNKGYIGTLEEPGLQLRDIPGARVGMEMFILEKTANENEYEGSYNTLESDGRLSERPVNVSIGGNLLTWNLESSTWERTE